MEVHDGLCVMLHWLGSSPYWDLLKTKRTKLGGEDGMVLENTRCHGGFQEVLSQLRAYPHKILVGGALACHLRRGSMLGELKILDLSPAQVIPYFGLLK